MFRFGRSKGVKVRSVYGGSSIEKQIKALKSGAHIVVGTPGRLLDLIKRKALKLDQIETLILDEADEMLNMGFLEDISAVSQKHAKPYSFQQPCQKRSSVSVFSL